MKPVGRLIWISGPVARARLEESVSLSEQVLVGEAQLVGEVIALEGNQATVQVYEETSGLRPGEVLFGSGRPLSVTLGPGLIGSVYDGIQRPLEWIRDQQGIYIQRGARAEALRNKRWGFSPTARRGMLVRSGAVLGSVAETSLIEHRILVPVGCEGTLLEIAKEGEYALHETLAVVEDAKGLRQNLTAVQNWPVRQERPVRERWEPGQPLITGQRVLDCLLPLAKGGVAAMPGPFGSGKTILLQALAKWCDAQIIVYIGCGERGNEMAEVLESFPQLIDPWTGHSLMERTILIANTSNMPVAAREASIYTGITLAEYYRDQGYHVALLADSTSRWAEALREIAGRLEEMPAEEGYPAYLPSRLAAFYERAGRVQTLGGGEGSIAIIATLSPPGGDFTEPVTQHTQRFVRTLWPLDRTLASSRHYPAINLRTGYSGYTKAVAAWWAKETGEDWLALAQEVVDILEQDAHLEQLVRLVGAEALPERQRWLLQMARLLKEGFLQQNALHPNDAYCTPTKQVRLLKLFVRLYEGGRKALETGVPLARLRQATEFSPLVQLRETVTNENSETIEEIASRILVQFQTLMPSEQTT